MADVAAAAGVSNMTVSNVLNDRRDRVSAETMERVLACVRKLDYVPNAQARALAASRSNIVALVYPGERSGTRALSNPHHAEFVGAVEREVSKTGRHLLVYAEEDITRIEESLRTWNVDGALFLGVMSDEARRLEQVFDIPMVFVDNYSPDVKESRVNIADFDGGYLACQLLVENGHRDIGFLSPPPSDVGVVRERLEGVLSALNDAGLDLPKDRRWLANTSFEDAIRAGREIAANPPTGLVVTADITAIGVMRALEEEGLRVPADVSVIGFDDLEAALYCSPQLTTIQQGVAEKAAAAVTLLVDEIEGVDGASERRVDLPVALVERGSVRDLNAARK